MWTLILTLSSYKVAAIGHVPGFTSKKACLTAAHAYVAHMKGSDNVARALCVKA